MIYIEFRENKPLFALTEMTMEEYSYRSKYEDIRAFESMEVFSEQYPDFKIPVPRKDKKMPQLRREAIRRIQKKANEYQEQVVGTNDDYRFQRFRLNLESAKAIVAGTATSYQESMLTQQLDANIAAEHPVVKDLDLAGFANWIIAFELVTVLGAGYIESVLITGAALINTAESSAEIEAILEQLAIDAEVKYQELIALIS